MSDPVKLPGWSPHPTELNAEGQRAWVHYTTKGQDHHGDKAYEGMEYIKTLEKKLAELADKPDQLAKFKAKLIEEELMNPDGTLKPPTCFSCHSPKSGNENKTVFKLTSRSETEVGEGQKATPCTDCHDVHLLGSKAQVDLVAEMTALFGDRFAPDPKPDPYKRFLDNCGFCHNEAPHASTLKAERHDAEKHPTCIGCHSEPWTKK